MVIKSIRIMINRWLLFSVGKPIDIPKIAQPSKDVVDKYHQIFVDELIKLFEEHKTKYSKHPDEMELVLDD